MVLALPQPRRPSLPDARYHGSDRREAARGAAAARGPGAPALYTVTPSTLATGLAGALRVPFTGTFWSFWFVNLGIAVPLSVAVAIATLVRRLSGRRLGDRVILGIPGPLLRF